MDGSGRRVVVVSIDAHNERPYTGQVHVMPLSRQSKPFAVPCGDTDAIGGHILVAELTAIRIGQLGDAVCLLSGPTLARLEAAICQYTDLNR
ncbi:hypothetical protein GCM10028833_40300 [Glycomyces tarimensis]